MTIKCLVVPMYPPTKHIITGQYIIIFYIYYFREKKQSTNCFFDPKIYICLGYGKELEY